MPQHPSGKHWPTGNRSPTAKYWPTSNEWPESESAAAPTWEPSDISNLVAWWPPSAYSGGTVTDQGANGYDLSEVTNPPTFEAAGYNGRPSLLFDGVNDKLAGSAALATAIIGGEDRPSTLWFVLEIPAIDSLELIFSIGMTGTTSTVYDLFVNNSGPLWQCNKRSSASGLAACTGGTPVAATRTWILLEHTGTVVSLTVNGSAIALSGGGAQNVGSMTVDGFALGCLYNNGAYSTFGNMRYADGGAAGALAADDRTELIDWMDAIIT